MIFLEDFNAHTGMMQEERKVWLADLVMLI